MAFEQCKIQFMERGRHTEPDGNHLYWLIASDMDDTGVPGVATIIPLTNVTPPPPSPHVVVEEGRAQAALDEAIDVVQSIGNHDDDDWMELRYGG